MLGGQKLKKWSKYLLKMTTNAILSAYTYDVEKDWKVVWNFYQQIQDIPKPRYFNCQWFFQSTLIHMAIICKYATYFYCRHDHISLLRLEIETHLSSTSCTQLCILLTRFICVVVVCNTKGTRIDKVFRSYMFYIGTCMLS